MNSREAFEKWAERIGCSVSRMRTRRDIYVEYDTTALWDCWQAATERAADICDGIAEDRWNLYKGRHPYSGREEGRASYQTQGENLGAEACATAIREGNVQ